MRNFLNSMTYVEDIDLVMRASINWNTLENSTILVTGAIGLIGSFLVDCLIVANRIFNLHTSVYAMSRSSQRLKERFSYVYDSNQYLKVIPADVCSFPDFETDFDYVIHAASMNHPVAFSKYPVDTMKTNIIGTINLLDYSISHSCKRFMYVSSSEVYGINDSSLIKPLIEDYSGHLDLTNARSAYPESKRAGEVLCTAYLKQHSLNTVSVRPWYIYGATMIDESSKADAQFLRKAYAKEDIILKSEGSKIRSYCYVADCVQALLCILTNGENGAYNIAGKDTATIKEFAEQCAETAGVSIIYEKPDITEELGYSLAPNGVCSAERAERVGYKPRVSLREGIKRSLAIMNENGSTNGSIR